MEDTKLCRVEVRNVKTNKLMGHGWLDIVAEFLSEFLQISEYEVKEKLLKGELLETNRFRYKYIKES